MSQAKFHPFTVGDSPIEKLPSEILYKILESVSELSGSKRTDSLSKRMPVDSNVNVQPTPSLLPCLLTSRTILAAGLPVMYRNVRASQVSTLEDLLAQLGRHPHMGTSVRSLGLSNIPASMRPRSRQTTNPLLEVLSVMPLIREVGVSQSLEDCLDFEVVQRLFCCLPYLETLNLSGCSSAGFVHGCSALFDQDRQITQSLHSITLAGCSNLPPDFFELLLLQVPLLKYLDVSKTPITTAALFNIPPTATLSHLNISHCYNLNGNELVNFLLHHSATKELVYLNLEVNPGMEHQIFSEGNIPQILSNLPSTMRSLNLKNSVMRSAYAPLLRGLSTHLEETSLGSDLRLRDIEGLFFHPESLADDEAEVENSEIQDPRQVQTKYQTVLTPMEEAIAVCKLRRRINFLPSVDPSLKTSHLRYLDISSFPAAEQCNIQTSILLGPQTRPLEIIEISENVLRRCGVLKTLCAAVGWEVKSVGRRCWLRRREN